jgi:hypothetical protein
VRAHQGVAPQRHARVLPLHVRRALELSGSSGGSRLRSSKGEHFGELLERFSEGEGSLDNDDAPLAVRARIRKGEAIARDEDEDGEDNDEIDDIGESNQELQQKAGPSTVAQDKATTLRRRFTGHPTAQCIPLSYTLPT